MNMFRTLAATFALVSGMSAAGQTASLRGVVSGLIYDIPSRSIRPVVGFPGSSYLGPPLLRDLEKAFIAPDGESALVVESGDVIVIRALTSGSPMRLAVPQLTAKVDRVAWAANSGSLIALDSAAHRLLPLDVKPSFQAGSPIDLSSLEGDVTELAANVDVTQVVVGIRHPAQGGFYALSPSGRPVRLSYIKDPGAAVFGFSSVFYAIDRETRQVVRFAAGIYGGGEPLGFAGEPDRMADPVGIALSADEHRLYLAGGSDRIIREYDLRSRELLNAQRTDIVPQNLSPLSAASSVFVIAQRITDDQPTWLLDTRSVPSITFVPAGQ
jgi:hypothetical protein